MDIVVASGGFDPIHSGHIEYLKSAKDCGDKLIVALNSDNWLEIKKGKPFMPFSERKTILESLKYVDKVIQFEDDKLGSCIDGLNQVKNMYPNDKIFFANGGDRNQENIPEMIVDDINFIFGVGGDNKKNSSSWILKEWNYYKEDRIWGSFFNLFEDKNVKVKELIVQPKCGMSFQKHFMRNEIWLVSQGSCLVNYSNKNPENRESIKLNTHDHYLVPVQKWHQITNPYNQVCKIIEIQYGEECVESDIERLDYYK